MVVQLEIGCLSEALQAIQPSAVGRSPADDLRAVLSLYTSLPNAVDVSLTADGIVVKTDDFPLLIETTCGFSIHGYVRDVLAQVVWISELERSRLFDQVYAAFAQVGNFQCCSGKVILASRGITELELPPALTWKFFQRATIEEQLSFVPVIASCEQLVIEQIAGIYLHGEADVFALRAVQVDLRGNGCIITPRLEKIRSVPVAGGLLDRSRAYGRSGLLRALLLLKQVKIESPCVPAEFSQYNRNIHNFLQFASRAENDLMALLEHAAGEDVPDPIIRAALIKATRVTKYGEQIELRRQGIAICNLGGVSLTMDENISCAVERHVDQLTVAGIKGVGLSVPFETPPELQAVGVDLRRSIPSKIVSLALSAPDEAGNRQLLVGTAPGCWIMLQLSPSMQPLCDSQGNWTILGVTQNPISSMPQRFFLRLDSSNNLAMTGREIAEILTQTAAEGFDPRDPATWAWGALALGGQTLLAADTFMAGEESDEIEQEIKRQARSLGRLIGKLLEEF
jgi:hypothetical protein